MPELLQGLNSNNQAFLELQAGLNKTLQELLSTLSRDSSERYQFREALIRLAELASSAKVLFDTLERNPESILTGKPQP